MNHDDQVRKYIGKVFYEKRLEKNYSQQAVADDLKIAKSTVSKIENGVGHTGLELLKKFTKYFGITMRDILPPPPSI